MEYIHVGKGNFITFFLASFESPFSENVGINMSSQKDNTFQQTREGGEKIAAGGT